MNEQNPKSTTTILDSNFKIWEDELYLLLSGNDLYKYTEEEILTKVNISNIKKEKLKEYIKVRGDNTKVYDKNVTNEDIKNDNIAKNVSNEQH